ncbi:centrosome-associated protein CEP250-like [Molothrus aeneus]|uniref:centrosome-associated protein CEP250-like n=1 Tax=Molothrus aeneus TaxID=84833 RepID=UPI0034584AA7
MNPGSDLEQRPASVPKLVWVKEEKEGPGTAPAQQPEEVEQFQLLQKGAAVQRAEGQERTRGLFRTTAQMVGKFMKRMQEEETSGTGTVLRAYPPIFKTKTSAALLYMLVEEGPSSPKQVPAMVRYIQQWLAANEFPEYNLYRPILDLTEALPADVVMALLRVAPSCNRAATTMWKTIMCSCRTAELAMLILLDVLANWPEHSTFTSDGDHTAVLALAATVVMWKILQMPCVPHVVTVHFPCLFMHLLFQVLFSTLDMTEVADTFWKGCQQQHGLATNPNSFAEQTLKALLCQLHYEDVAVAMEDQRGWDTLLCADTHRCAVGMLAREMHHASEALCSAIAFHLLGLLSKDMPSRYLAAMAFLVEILDCLDLSECRDSVLEVMSKNLQSQCREMRGLALRGLLVLSTSLSAIRRWSRHERLVELLQENDSDMLRMTMVLLSSLFLCNGAPIASPLALQLAGALLPLFDNDDSQVQLCSMFIFREMLNFLPEGDKKAMKSYMHQSLLPLFFHCHDKNQRVAEVRTQRLPLAPGRGLGCLPLWCLVGCSLLLALVLVDGGDSMANSIICTNNPGNILSTLTSTDEQHPFELAREATENCERMWQQFDQVEERTQRIRSQYQLIDSLLEEICSDCAKFEKSKEMLLQCTGIPETAAFCLQQQNTKQQKEASVQAEEAEQQDWMEVSQEEESSSWSLELLSQESSDQGHEVAQVWQEEELLAQKADLEGRLAATEWLRQDLARQLEETRSAKERLQSRLFAAQQQISQLEMTWKRVEAELQGELQGARREAQAEQRRHEEELQGLKDERNLLCEQREALEKQVAELTSQLAASRECQERTAQRAQQDVREGQEESRQKLLELEEIQNMLEEAEHQNKELQVHLEYLEREWIQWEEVAQQNSELQASVNALEKEKARLILSLEEKNVCLMTLEEQNSALNNQVSQCQSALQETEQLYSEHRRELLGLNTQAWALLEAVKEKAAFLETRQKQLETEESELRVRLQSSEEISVDIATQCKAMELELRKRQAQRDNLRARNRELLKQLEQSEKAMLRAEHQKISHENSQKKDAIALKEDDVTLCHSLQRNLEDLEKQRKDVLHERELYQQQMRYLEKKNEMHAPEMSNHKGNNQELQVEREELQEDLEHEAAALKKLRDNNQVLSAALNKSELAKGVLKQHLDILKEKIPADTGIVLQSTPVPLKYFIDVSHEEVSQEEESSSWCLELLSQESSDQGHEVAQVWQEEELLAQKADLEGRLAATEWLRQDLARQLEETRSAKERLQSRLFAAQQQISQLEMTWKRVEAELQGELQGARREAQAEQRRHEEELQGLKDERNLLCEQREALEKQVAELTSQLAASRECQESTAQRTQQEGMEAQEESRQKLLELEEFQNMLEEAEHQNKELQVHLEYLEREWIQWEEVAQQNSELQASVNALEKEKARLILSLEEKNVCLMTLEEQNSALNNQVSQCQSALQETEQLYSEHRRELLGLNTQAWALLEAVKEKAAFLETRQKQLETEESELRVRLQSSEEISVDIATQCKAMELELRKRQAQRDNLRARNRELLKQLEQSEKAMLRAEHQKISHENSQKKDAIALKEDDVTLCHSLQRNLEDLEKQRKDVLHERELYQQQMRYLEKKNEMHAPEMSNHKGNNQELQVEREELQEDLEHEAAALKKLRDNNQVLSAALNKSELAKGVLKQHLDILKEKIPADTGIVLQSTPVPLKYFIDVSHEEVSQEEESSSWSLELLSQESSDQGHEVAQVWQEEELLAQKADLEGRLAATEWLRQDLARQLEETRSAKERLQSRLFAAQQQISQLEMTWKRVEAELQGELQGARREAQAAQRRHEEELQGLKDERNLLCEQREALEKQVAELTSQLAASRECQESTAQRTQQDVREGQEESRQKLLELEEIQNMLEEAEHQNKELQVHLEYLEREWIQWEEVAQQNSELQASVNALEKEKARLILSLEEKNVCLMTLEEQNSALNNQVSQCQSALQETEQLYSEHRRELLGLNTQAWALLEAVKEKAAFLETRQKQLETEESELRVRLQSSEEISVDIATQCKAMELELRKRQAQRDNLRARNRELLKQLEQSEKAMLRAEHQKISHENSQKKDAIALKEDDVTLCHSLQRNLEDLEKQRKDVLHERELYQQQMRYLEKKNEMHAPEMSNHKGNNQELQVEREELQEDLEREAAALKKLRDNNQVLSAALNKSELAKGVLKKHLDILKEKIPADTGIVLQSTPVPLKYFIDVSHEEVSQEEESSSWCLEQLSQESSDQGHEVAQVWREEELLAQKADLEGRLAATEWLRQDLARQLEETRSAKERLQSRLFAAQQQISQLEMTWKRVEAELQGELQGARREAQAEQRRHEEELQGLKDERNLLCEQREALEKQVAELTSQLAASRECQERTAQRAQQDVREGQEESRQKLLELEEIQNMLEEAEHQNKELQVHLEYLEREWIQWEEVAQQNSELQASVNALEKEKARLILSLEEKNVCLMTLEEQNSALNNQVSQCQSALQETEQLYSEHRRELLGLNTQAWALLEAVKEKAAFLETRQKQLETEESELRVRLQSSEERAEAMATQCKAMELELRKTQAQRDNLRARNRELLKQLEQSEKAMLRAEHQKISHENSQKKDAIALKEEDVVLRHSLEKELQSLQEESKDVLVSQEEESSSWSLELLSQESSDQGHEVAQAWREEELLAQKADLEGRLAATEWLRQDLARQLEETRSAKERLQSRLFAAQQQISQLEMTWKRVEAELQGELQGARREAQAEQRRHEEELQGLKDERNLLCEQREALEKQVAELTSQLAASRECQERTAQRAQQDVREAQEESRQKLLELEEIQNMLEEAKHQNKELQVHLEYLEREWIQWEEVAQQNSELQASVNALEKEKARLILSLEEKNVCLMTLEEQNSALNNQVSQCQSALQETEQLYSEHRRELLGLNTQAWALLEAVKEKAAFLETRQKQLESEESEVCVRLQSSEERAEAMATQCKAMELELRKTQAQRDNLRARNRELLKQLEQSEKAMLRAEHQKISHENSQKKDAIALKEEDVVLRHSLEKELQSLQEESKDVLHERELYQQQMRYLEKKNEMHTPEMSNHKGNNQELQVEREELQEDLEHEAAALKKLRDNNQVLSAALNKSELAKGVLKKHLDILKEKIPADTGIVLQSTPVPLKYFIDVSHEEVSQEEESSSWSLELLSQESSDQGHEVAQVWQEEELLAQKADLEGRLAATEWLRQDLARQLEETRSAKERLQSRLFAAQQQISQLEITRNHLEAQVLTVTQDKEVIEGEVKCLQGELEAERALRRQEQEDTAQQPLQAEQQHQESLRLQGTAQQLEIKKLLQDLASERERHRAEMEETLEQWEKEKAERGQEHKKVLFEMRQKVATLLAQQEELKRFENAKQEMFMAKVLLEEQKEKSALSEALLQTQGELSRARQQVQQLRQEVTEQQEKGQTIKANLQDELQEAHSEAQAAQRRHEEELQGLKEERNLLLEQREALEKQVAELTSQLAASRECQERTAQRAQQEGMEAQEESRQKLLEIEQTQKMLEEAEHQNKELQVHLEYLERERSQWEEVAPQNSELQASINALEKEKARLILSLEEKNVCLRTLEEQNLALNNQVSQCQSALQQAKQLSSNRAGQLRELNTQIRALQDAVLQMEASQATQQKQLLKELEESRAGERSLRDSVHVLQAEVSELRVKLQSSDDKALALAIQCEAVELELRKTQAQRDNLRARNRELQKELDESEQDWWKEEVQHISRESALEKEATERQEEAVALRQEVASLKKKLEILEKQRKDVLHERELYQQQMRYLEKKNEMHAPEMSNHKGNNQELQVEREELQEDLEHEAAALKKSRDKTQVDPERRRIRTFRRVFPPDYFTLPVHESEIEASSRSSEEQQPSY